MKKIFTTERLTVWCATFAPTDSDEPQDLYLAYTHEFDYPWPIGYLSVSKPFVRDGERIPPKVQMVYVRSDHREKGYASELVEGVRVFRGIEIPLTYPISAEGAALCRSLGDHQAADSYEAS